MSELSAKKAAIKRAQRLAIASYFELDKQALKQLEDEYRDALDQLLILLAAYADTQGVLRLNTLNQVINDTERVLAELANTQRQLGNNLIERGSRLGAQPFLSEMGTLEMEKVVERSTRFVNQFTHKDGLQLSDRYWIVSNDLKTKVVTSINSAIIQGHSASEAAATLIAAGERPSADILKKINKPSTQHLGIVLKDQFFDDDSAYWKARTLFRTEINRAYGITFQNSLNNDDDVAGTRFVLSPNHPRVDICDMHASANLFGLGRGVYPKNKNPWPAHPNTLSYLEVVFTDEVTDEDRAGKETAIDWLNTQASNTRVGVLGKYKSELLNNGELKVWMIKSKVSNLKKRNGN